MDKIKHVWYILVHRDEMVVGNSSSCANLNGVIVYYFKQATNPGRNNYGVSIHNIVSFDWHLVKLCTVCTPVLAVTRIAFKIIFKHQLITPKYYLSTTAN